MKVYKTDIYSDDLHIVDFTMVSTSKELYVPGSYYVEKINDKDIRDISVFVKCDNKLIVDWLFQFDHLQKVSSSMDISLNDFGVNKHDTIMVEIKYTLDGTEKQFIELVNLNDILKSN